ATSRKKALDKINLDEIKPSNRKYPAIMFNNMEREAGDQILIIENLTKVVDGTVLFKDINLMVNKGDKIAILSRNSLATSAFYDILSDRDTDYTGSFKWGVTISIADMPIDSSEYFEGKDDNLIDWLREFSNENKDDQFIRGFL